MEYNFRSIEKKWQKYWREKQIYNTKNKSNLPKYYVLDMFPYPSGSGLHVGHPLGYIASDIISRYKRSKGFNVLHPMGFDSFGLPAEQYAIKTGHHPKITTEKNITRFKEQLNRLGLSYDWSREIKTSDSSYYKWTQWIFLKLYNSYFDKEKNKAFDISKLNIPEILSDKEKIKFIDDRRLAYIDEIDVNWCEELGTVLANEEVIGGLSERGGHPVVRRPMKQWVMRITDYADRLIDDLDELDWPESIKTSQRNWIGRSYGAEIIFQIDEDNKIEVFTTRPDTIFGATYLVIAPEHPILDTIVTDDQKKEINNYKEIASTKSDLERQENQKNKTGIFTGTYATNPITKNKIPIWVSDYVLYGYGTGAIMAVPAHDQRDFEFAKKFDLKILKVIKSDNEFYSGSGEIINSGNYNGMDSMKFQEVVLEILEKDGKAKKTINYKLRDWIFTRQRYWGEPIPILFSEDGMKAIDEKDLPLELPEVDSYLPTDNGMSPLARNLDWKFISIDGKEYIRETNTMPQWAGSCWYYLRFLDPNNDSKLASEDSIKYWMPVDLYIGGAEHAVLHLLYSRFWHKVLFDLGFVNTKEPFKKLVNQGMILGNSAYIFRKIDQSGYVSSELKSKYNTQKILVDVKFVNEKNELDIDLLKNENPELKHEVFEFDEVFKVHREVEKMSKSKYNVVNPDDICEKFGTDTLRMYEMFLGPLEQSKPWNTAGISGIHNFLKKFWKLYYKFDKLRINNSKPTKDSLKTLHRCIKKVSSDIESFSFNTAVSTLMITVNELTSQNCKSKEILEPLLIVLSPFAPHICEEIWEQIGNTESITFSNFPEYIDSYLEDSTKVYPVSINGKLKYKIELSTNLNKEEIKKAILSDQNFIKKLDGNQPKRIIIIPGKIINFVI
ncbi:MAG: leucine--tRNA ligase [Flammeovirgaceae bacterium]|nr:leucine--tRNA ligase [Flammeovirgaceae bacterium]|tara:strand:- start:14188 stop:16872 length:2685 start_codon:yes stop_codon:yes gene_type:complete